MEADWLLIISLLIAGAIGGFISGLLGVGGGLIFIPVLDLMLSPVIDESHELVKYLLANSLFILFFSGLMNAVRQIRIGNYYPTAVLYTAAAGIVTVLVSTWLISSGTWYSRKLFSSIFIALLVPLTLNMFRKQTVATETVMADPLKLLPIGLGGGLVSAFAGLGGGVLMIPTLTSWLKLPMKIAASISAGVIPYMALPMLVQYAIATPAQPLAASIGYLLPLRAMPMVIGAISTVSLGIKMGHRWPDSLVRSIFAVFILLVMARNIYVLFF